MSIEKHFIILGRAKSCDYTLSIARESVARSKKNIIQLIEIDCDCTAYCLLGMCYGLRDDSAMIYEDEEFKTCFLPSFVVPMQEEKNPILALQDKNSVIGHIKYCLEMGLDILKTNNVSRNSVANLRRESLGKLPAYIRQLV